MTIFVTAGGTGGHIFPGYALYGELTQRGHEVLFVGADVDYTKFECLERLGNRFIGLPVQQYYRKKLWKNAASSKRLFSSVRKARALIRAIRPDVCVGMGGFASAPMLIACRKSGIPYCIAEQNAWPGRANKHFARKAAALFLNFRHALELFSARARKRAHVTGNPVRPNIGKVAQGEARKRMGVSGQDFVLGVMGGSQGAQAINNAVLAIANRHRNLTILWSCGRRNYDELARNISGLSNIHLYPFVDDMAAFLSASNLVISRAGATSLSELAACQTPSILIPYPYASDDHQRRNARAWEEAGAAVVVTEGQDFDEILEHILDDLVQDRQQLTEMCKAASRLYDPRTLARMADLVEEIARGERPAVPEGAAEEEEPEIETESAPEPESGPKRTQKRGEKQKRKEKKQ